MRLVADGVVQGDPALRVLERGGELADVEEGAGEGVVRFEQERVVVCGVGDREQLVGERARLGKAAADDCECPQAPQRRKWLRGLAELITQRARRAERALDVGRRVALPGHQRHAEQDLERELAVNPLECGRRSVQQLDAAREIGHRLGIRRALHGARTRGVPLIDRLVGAPRLRCSDTRSAPA